MAQGRASVLGHGACSGIAVIGGGIAGLTVALRRAAAGDQVVLIESAAKVGGQLATESARASWSSTARRASWLAVKPSPRWPTKRASPSTLVEQLVQRSFRFEAGAMLELAPGEAGRLLGFRSASDELGRGIRSFWHGMGELPERLALALSGRIELRLGSEVRSVATRSSGVTLATPQSAREDFDAVVVATTARSAAACSGRLWAAGARPPGIGTALELDGQLAFRSDQVQHPLDATGFIVPRPEQLAGLRAVTFTSSKLPHRAPPGWVLLRLFFRPSAHDLQSVSDTEWAERAEGALRLALPITGAAEKFWVSRWSDALPIFDDAHRARVAVLEAALLEHPIRLAGAAFHGSGIDAAIRSGECAALALPRPSSVLPR